MIELNSKTDSQLQLAPLGNLGRFAAILAIVIVLLVSVWTARQERSDQGGDTARQSSVTDEDLIPNVEAELLQVSSPPSDESTQQPEDVDDPPGLGSGASQPPIHVWSLPPEDLADLIKTALLSETFGVLWDVDVSCTETFCDVRYKRSRGGNMAVEFVDFVRGAPINAMGVGITWDANADGTYTYSHEVSTFREQPPEDYRGMGMTARELELFGQGFLSPNDIFAPPVVLEMRDDVTLVIENICSTDCPLDLRQVLHWRSSAGRPCEELGAGVAERFLIRAADGSYEDRTLCVEIPYD